MEVKMIMARYGELSTKGKNKKDFIRLLGQNVKNAFKKFKNVVVEVKHDHIYIHLNGHSYEEVANRLKPKAVVLENVPGIAKLYGGKAKKRIYEDFITCS